MFVPDNFGCYTKFEMMLMINKPQLLGKKAARQICQRNNKQDLKMFPSNSVIDC